MENYSVMIISENIDISTSKVIAWLKGINQVAFRVNDNLLVDILTVNDKQLIINNIDLLNSSVIWDRRGNLRHKLVNSEIPKSVFEVLGEREWKMVRDYMFFIIQQKGIGSFRHELNHNRLIDLYIQDTNNIYSKPIKCNYNPYNASWEN